MEKGFTCRGLTRHKISCEHEGARQRSEDVEVTTEGKRKAVLVSCIAWLDARAMVLVGRICLLADHHDWLRSDETRCLARDPKRQLVLATRPGGKYREIARRVVSPVESRTARVRLVGALRHNLAAATDDKLCSKFVRLRTCWLDLGLLVECYDQFIAMWHIYRESVGQRKGRLESDGLLENCATLQKTAAAQQQQCANRCNRACAHSI